MSELASTTPATPDSLLPPRLCADLPGVGGLLKSRHEDFVVEEVEAYPKSGEGSHIYLWIEKRDVSPSWLIKRLSQHFDVPRKELGTAGNKDRHGITRQWVSVSAHLLGHPEDLDALTGPVDENIQILAATRHNNKLKTGHLNGNLFTIRLRDLALDDVDEITRRVEAIAARLLSVGAPNPYGLQRFGRDLDTHELGFAMLRQEPAAIRRVRADRFLKRLAVNAAQSALFNEVMTARMAAGGLDRVLEGDVVKLHRGGMFVVGADEVEETQRRLEEGDLRITGPMFGPKMRRPAGPAAAIEQEVLERAGLSFDAFASWGKLCAGARREFLAPLERWSWEIEPAEGPDGDGLALRLGFFLPSGGYATILVREFSGLAG